MGRIVAAFATSHIVMDPKGVELQFETVMAGFQAIRKQLKDSAPDALVLISDDHLLNFFLDNMPAFCLGTGEDIVGFGDLDLPKYRVRVHQDFAKSFLDFVLESEFDFAYSEELIGDHGIILPLHLIRPEMDIPIIPILQNCFSPPLPTPKRCYELGVVLRKFIEERRPESERIALVGAGGLSHWLGVPEMGKVGEEFDKHVLGLIAQGNAKELSKLTYEEILIGAGNGGQEIRNWITVMGAMDGYRGKVLYYEPIAAWVTGMAAVAMDTTARS